MVWYVIGAESSLPCHVSTTNRGRLALRERHAQGGMRPHGERHAPSARELERQRALVAARVELHHQAHRRARPAIRHLIVPSCVRYSPKNLHPLAVGALAAVRAETQPEQRDRRRGIGNAGRKLLRPSGSGLHPAGFRELDHDAQRLLGMEKRLDPVGVRVVEAHRIEPERPRAVASRAGARNLEGHMVDAGPALGQEAAEEPVLARGLDHLDLPAALVGPGGPAEDLRGPAAIGHAAQHAVENGRRVGDAGQTKGDVIEEDALHPAQAFQALASNVAGSGMKRLFRGASISRVMWPCPVVSSASMMSPGPKRRLVPSPHSTSARPASVITNWRRGATWKSSAPPAGVSRKITPSEGTRSDRVPYVLGLSGMSRSSKCDF